MQDWIPALKARPLAEVARELGLEHIERPAPGSLSPCPACHDEARGGRDRRGPVGLTRDGQGFRCHRCDAAGDAVTLAALVLCGTESPDREGWRALGNRFGLPPGNGPRPRYRVPFPRPAPKPPAPPNYPPENEVEALWASCMPVDTGRIAGELRARDLDPEAAADWDLARELPAGLSLGWAFGAGAKWGEAGRRLVLPMYDGRGVRRSLHLRSLPKDAPKPKGVSPQGFEVAGLVFACPLARQLLAGEDTSWWEDPTRTLLVVEGAVDFLLWATHAGDTGTPLLDGTACLAAPAVLGIISGSWTDEIAGRLAGRVGRVIVRRHLDPAGAKYAERIRASLLREGVRVGVLKEGSERDD